MTATRNDIKRWLGEALDCGATHLIVVHDTYDDENYPVFVSSEEKVKEKMEKFNFKNMQRIEEVYSMVMDLEDQLLEDRAFHIN